MHGPQINEGFVKQGGQAILENTHTSLTKDVVLML